MAERGCGPEPAAVPRGPRTPYTGVQTGAPGQQRVGLGRRAATIRGWSWLSTTPLALLWAARSGPPLPEGTTPGPRQAAQVTAGNEQRGFSSMRDLGAHFPLSGERWLTLPERPRPSPLPRRPQVVPHGLHRPHRLGSQGTEWGRGPWTAWTSGVGSWPRGPWWLLSGPATHTV